MLGAPSTLYGLDAVAPNTPQAESLRSYVQRLAYAHSVSPSRLVSELLVQQPLETVSQCSIKNSLDEWNISGKGEVVEALLARLQSATYRELRPTVAARFGHLFAVQRFTRAPALMHCPHCVREEAWEGLPYGRLLWELTPVTCCPVHRVRLVDSRRCGAQQQVALGFRKRPLLAGVCALCGSIGFACRADSSEPASEEELWIANQVGALVALSAQESQALQPAKLREGIVAAIEAVFGGKVANAAIESGLGRTSVLAWVKHERLPSLDSLLKFCWRAQADLLPLLRGSYQRCSSAAGVRSESLAKRRYCRDGRDWDGIRALLIEEALKRNPRTACEVAKELGMWPSNLRLNLPDEYNRLAERSKQYQAALLDRKLDDLKSAFRSAAKALAQESAPITKTSVVKRSGLTVFNGRSRIRHAALREVLREFGVGMAPTGASLGLKLGD